MKRLEPIKGEHFLNRLDIYRVERVNKSLDSVEMVRLRDGERVSTRFDTFFTGFEQVWKVGEIAGFLNRSPRSIYRYEQREQIEKPNRYFTQFGLELRFYTKRDVMEIHEMISQISQGRPRKDKRVSNNSLPTKSMLLQMFRKRYGI